MKPRVGAAGCLRDEFRISNDKRRRHFYIEAVAKEAVALRQLRREVMAKMNWSLRDLYRTLEEPGAPPGLPLPVKEHGKFVTGDCIRCDQPIGK